MMRECPNPAYKGIKCPYALSEMSPLPCFGSQQECDTWREKLEKEETENNG